MIYLIYLFLIAAFALFFIGLFPKPPDTISVFGDQLKPEKGSVFSPVLRPFVPINKRLLKFLKADKTLQAKIDLVKWKVTPAEFFGGRMFLALVFIFIPYFIFDYSRGWGLTIFGLIGFIIPGAILRSRVKRRKYAIARVLPETVDLLGLCVGAGLDFMAAVRWVIDKVKVNPLIEELTFVLKEINVGKPRVEALKDMSKRLQIPDLVSFVRTLVQADRMGTPVEEAFKILSEDTRLRRYHRAERQAMKAPLKMLIPLIFCILPVILIIVAGPILLKFIRGDLFGGIGM